MKQKIFRTILIAVAVGAVFVFTIYQYYRQAGLVADRMIADHVTELSKILHKIDTTCAIEAIMHERNYIDFLTVKSFVGSEVGSLNLKYPNRWQGPYLNNNYTMQGKLYEIIKTKEGYYIVPGQGVELSNHKVIGKDIIFSQTDIESLVNNPIGLEYYGRPLAVRLNLQIDPLAPDLLARPGYVEKIK